MLFVHNGKAQPVELDIGFQQRMSPDGDLHQTGRDHLLQLRFLTRGGRPRQQHRHVIQLREQVLEVEEVLRRQNFRRRQHRHLIAVLDGDDRRLRRHQCLAAAHVALQQPVHRMRVRHILRDLRQHLFLCAGGFEGQHGFDLLAHAFIQFEPDAGLLPCLRLFQSQPALQPEELLEDHAEMRLRPERVQQPQVFGFRREMDEPRRRGPVRQFQPLANRRRQRVFQRSHRIEQPLQDRTEHTGGDLAAGFIDRYHAARMQGRFAFFIVAGENLILRTLEHQIAGVAIQFHLSVERQPHALHQFVGQVGRVEPLRHQFLRRAIAQHSFEDAQVLAPERDHLARADLRDHRRHLAGSQLPDRFQVAAILIAQRRIGKQVFNRSQTFGLEHRCPAGSNSFYVCSWGSKVHRKH